MNHDPTDINLVQAKLVTIMRLKLIEQYQNRLYRALIPITNNAEEALDVTQETSTSSQVEFLSGRSPLFHLDLPHRLQHSNRQRRNALTLLILHKLHPSSDQSAEQRLENTSP